MPTRDTATPAEPQLFSAFGVSGVHDSVRAAPRSSKWLCALLLAVACGRTSLEPFGAEPVVNNKDAATAPDHAVDVGADLAIERAPDAQDAAADLPVDRPVEHAPPACVPATEICNGADDDCDGQTDEDLPAIPCPNGGNQYCVAGRYSDCPRRCEVCVPGSSRTCFTSFCTYWGSQACAPDGRSFGACAEERAVPPECQDLAKSMQRSAALEQCCIDNGYCCVDTFDLDQDGDKTEMLGHCESVTCGP